MSEIRHSSLKAELLYLLGRASAPLSSAELYERCELADETHQVAKAIANLQSDGRIVRVPGEGRARYRLADGVTAPAPAGKAGRSKAVQKDDAAQQAAGYVAANLAAAAIAPVAKPEQPIEAPQAPTADARPEKNPADAKLADAILGRLKRDLGPLLRPPLTGDLEVNTAPGAININVELVEINISIGVAA